MHDILTPTKIARNFAGVAATAAFWYYYFGRDWAIGYAVVTTVILVICEVAIWRSERFARINARAGFTPGQRLQRLEPWWDGWKKPRPEPRLVTYQGPALSLGWQVVRYDDDPYDHWCKTEYLVPAPLPHPFCPEGVL